MHIAGQKKTNEHSDIPKHFEQKIKKRTKSFLY